MSWKAGHPGKKPLRAEEHCFFFRSKAGHSKQRREPTNWPYIWSPVPNQTWATLVYGLYRVPKLFERISSDIIVSSKGWRLGARNCAVILVFIPFTTYEKNSFLELAGLSFTNGFSVPKTFRDFRETGPRIPSTYSHSHN